MFPMKTHDDSGVEYLEMMRKLAAATLLPKSELMTFHDDPLKYFSFIKTFENNVKPVILAGSFNFSFNTVLEGRRM